MGKAANRGVLFDLDSSLEQVLQELINVLPVSARIPSEVRQIICQLPPFTQQMVDVHYEIQVDYELQRKVGALFQSAAYVNERLPSFVAVAERMRARWLARQRMRPPATRSELQL